MSDVISDIVRNDVKYTNSIFNFNTYQRFNEITNNIIIRLINFTK